MIEHKQKEKHFGTKNVDSNRTKGIKLSRLCSVNEDIVGFKTAILLCENAKSCESRSEHDIVTHVQDPLSLRRIALWAEGI